jgi:hypothetical protein
MTLRVLLVHEDRRGTLGTVPSTPLGVGLARTVDWYRGYVA